jgi:hypothetical protein
MTRWVLSFLMSCLLLTPGALSQAPTTISTVKPRTIVTTDMEQDDCRVDTARAGLGNVEARGVGDFSFALTDV